MFETQISHEAPVTFLRGLQARCRWAAAHPGTDEFGYGDAQALAYCQGRIDFENGRPGNDVPPLLADVVDLSRAWREGWMDA